MGSDHQDGGGAHAVGEAVPSGDAAGAESARMGDGAAEPRTESSTGDASGMSTISLSFFSYPILRIQKGIEHELPTIDQDSR